MQKMKVLIITPDINRLGGIANHYLGLKSQWSLDVDYLYFGKRNENESKLHTAIQYVSDYVIFAKALKKDHYDVVVVNPSLRWFQDIIASIYICIARFFKCQIVTFFHGFSYDYYDIVKKHPKRFRSIYNYSSFIYVLYSEYARLLKEIGIRVPLLQTTTKVAEEYSTIIGQTRSRTSVARALFVGRLVKEKGIFECLDVSSILLKKGICHSLVVCGDGPERLKVNNFAYNIKGRIICKGVVVGDNLANEYKNADVLFLLSYGEGLATCLLEAMAFGLVIIATPVGGIQDFFEDGLMGYIVNKDDVKEIVSKMEYLKAHPEVVKRISDYNRNYAQRHFMASAVAKKMEQDILNYCIDRHE